LVRSTPGSDDDDDDEELFVAADVEAADELIGG
jgi:hypothetical protein